MKLRNQFAVFCLLSGVACKTVGPKRPSFGKTVDSSPNGMSPSVENSGASNSGNDGSTSPDASKAPVPLPGSFSVGLVSYAFVGRCTATIIKHGVALTAKHCFTDKEIEPNKLGKIMISFAAQSMTNTKPLAIRGEQIKKVIFDGPSSDIAYILYTPAATQDLTLDLPHFVSAESLAKGRATKVIGYPVEESATPTYPKVERGDCSFTGKKGTIPPGPDGNRYDGQLYENDCKGWWGMSGGPALDMSDAKNPKVIGVIAHTFELTEEGDIDPSKIEKDQFGNFIKGVAISPLTEAKQLNAVLQMDPSKLPSPTTEKNPSIVCGYSSMTALLGDARKALDYLKAAKSVDPLFWAGNVPDEVIPGLRSEMTKRNALFKSDQAKTEASLPFMKDVFADYYSMLNSPYLTNFKALEMLNFGLTSDYNACPDPGCTEYGAFIIQGYRPEIEALQKSHAGTFRPMMKKILAHEIGHFVWDHYILVSKMYPSYEDAISKQDPLKIHLVVDGIGSILAGVTPAKFSQIFGDMKTTIHGVTDYSADTGDRNFCFTQLPP